MGCELTVYSFNDVAAYLNRVLVSGLFEGDDVVMIEPNADIATASVGADGNSLVSVAVNDAATITLKLQPTSETHKQLKALYADMKAGRFVAFPFSATDTRNGEGGGADECVIMKKPSDQYGTNATVREWVLHAACWKDNAITYT